MNLLFILFSYFCGVLKRITLFSYLFTTSTLTTVHLTKYCVDKYLNNVKIIPLQKYLLDVILFSSMSDDMVTSPLVLDFGDVNLRRAVTKQLIITNHTAIPAPFNVEVEYFTGYNPSKLAGQSHKR